MEPITFIDRLTGKQETEKVYGQAVLNFLYGPRFFSKIPAAFLRYLLSCIPVFSKVIGYYHKTSASKNKIRPFIEDFQVDASEFREEVDAFQTFNDFFIRKLKPEKRPIASAKEIAVIPADGRYLFIPHIKHAEGFVVKEQKFDLSTLLQNDNVAHEYENGTMVIARLCPSDYHRFHFPSDCNPSESKLINGYLYSVNPIAVKKNIHIFTQNKRTVCELQTISFGKVLFLEIGATGVGSINQTYHPHQFYSKGEEKGYFSFGASSLILLFPPDSIQLDDDLLANPYVEIKCLMGQSMGRANAI
jgi:phosphatidylserine decarboxylase